MSVANLPALLEHLGVEEVREMGDEVYGLCPMHVYRMGYEQARPHWSMNMTTGLHCCFSCGWKGSLVGFVMQMKHCSVERAQRIVRKFGVDNILANIYWAETPVEEELSLDVQFRMFVDPPAEELAARHISAHAADVYDVRWDNDFGGWVFPVRDPAWGLIGWQLKAGHKVRNYPRGIRRSRTLFGVEHMDSVLVYAVLVESPLDAVRLLSTGLGLAAFASFGANVSDAQMSLLVENYEHVVLALDNDDAGFAAMDKLVARWASRTNLELINYDDESPKDVGEMTDKQIWQSLNIYNLLSSWQWMQEREGAQAPVEGRKGVVPVPAGSRRPDGRTEAAARGYGNGARQNGGNYRRRRASHRSG